MCGIIGILSESPSTELHIESKTEKLLKNRGPDSSKIIIHDDMLFGGFVLWHQGSEVCIQPFENKNIILLFNGDLFNVDELKNDLTSDTSWLADRISYCESVSDIVCLLRYIEGPYSLIFYNKNTRDLYFARDSLGRNSLLLEKDSSFIRILSSSCVNGTQVSTTELPPLGLFKLNCRQLNEIEVFPWRRFGTLFQDQLNRISESLKINFVLQNVLISPFWMSFPSVEKIPYDLYELCEAFKQSPPNELFNKLLSHKSILCDLKKFDILLRKSIRSRVLKTPNCCQRCLVGDKNCSHAKIAILFSGGIDCSILAVLISQIIPEHEPIDLLNFSCENGKTRDWNTPDRITAKASLVELRELCPLRKWNLVEINATRSQCYDVLKNHLKHLIFPLNTVLDESLGAAFWFASQGEGVVSGEHFKSNARVIIVGSGADELFGGYQRHRNAYLRCHGDIKSKNEAVQKELDMDWERISMRNLARDDRVISDSKRTPRAPYIEELLVQFVRTLKACQLSCYTLCTGTGDKLFLRLYGYLIGLRYAASLQKRAIQFGSRIANKKQNASDVSEYISIQN